MKLEDCIKRIDRYMHSMDNHPRLVNVRNQEDMKSIYTHFKVGVNIFKDVSDYARNDENPSEAALFDDLRKLTGTIFVTGFTTFYKMIGEQKLRELLNKLVALTNAKLKIVVLCYQCEKFLAFSDSRYRTWVYDVKGITSTNPNLVFVSPEMPDWDSTQSIEGIQNVPFFIEQNKCDEVHVKTAKTKNNYNHSLFDISEQTKLFDLLLQIDPITNTLKESYGTDEQWKKAMTEIKASSWTEYIRKSFGAVETLHLALPDWNSAKDYTKWLYFIALKLYGTPNNAYMNMAVESANSVDEIVKCLYQCILEVPCSDKEYWELYEERKALLKKLCCNDSKQIADYCDWVMEKECASIEQVGNKVIYLPVDRNGIVDTNTLQEALVNKVALVSVMYANNEIGSLEPIHELCNIAHRNGAKFHTDAVQAVGHVKIDVKEIGVDMMSASAHKFNGPKGIGFLYVKTGTALKPFADGGAQEYGMRAGTENVAGIVAMSVALKKACSHIDDRRKHLLKLEDVLLQGLKKYNTDFIRNGSSNRVPGNISLSFKNANGEMLLHRLDLMGIMVSTGSACDSTNTQMSHVLKAIKIPEEYGFGTIRISFNHENTEEDAKYIAESIGKILTTVTKAKLKRS